MGTAHTFHEFGKLKVHFIHNGRLVARETDPPPLEIQTQLRGYLASYDAYLMKHGNDYTVRNPAAKSQLQDAEQAWHDCIVPSLAARGLGPRPDWALEPLPGLRRVRIAPAPAATFARAPGHAPAPPRARRPPSIRLRTPTPAPARRLAPFPTLPTPPPSSPARSTVPEVIDLTHIDYEPARRAPKRRFPEVIHVSDDEDVEMIPKGAIRKALDMGNTAFTEATQMIGIINTYTAEGPNFSQEVVDQTTRSNEEDSKATELKGFLQDWQRHHSNQ
ncbi:hypothetical protein DFH09DRAFT_1343681 [Mycena vulgaris]|nr:hypothetical protein DFH09DRAFT_1343681 [Mycena vulgaris]